MVSLDCAMVSLDYTLRYNNTCARGGRLYTRIETVVEHRTEGAHIIWNWYFPRWYYGSVHRSVTHHVLAAVSHYVERRSRQCLKVTTK